MHISLARKHCKVSMKYYNERMATLERNFPHAYPFELQLTTGFIHDDFPVTQINMTRTGETVKKWILLVDSTTSEEMTSENPQITYVNLQKIPTWHKAKRMILEEIKEEIILLDQKKA